MENSLYVQVLRYPAFGRAKILFVCVMGEDFRINFSHLKKVDSLTSVKNSLE